MYEDLFAERIVALRNRKNVSAREMSLAIGQNASYINRIENKQAFPSMQSFFYICEYLEISPRDFFDYDTAYPKELHDINNLLSTLDKETFETVYKLIKTLSNK